MTLFAHEHVIVANPGLRDERVIYTGDDEFFRTREAAQASADRMNAAHDLGLEVYMADEPIEPNPENIYGLASIQQSIEEDRK